MSRWQVASLRRLPVADTVFTVGLIVIFGMAYQVAEGWPTRTALFPRLVAGVSFLLAILKLLSLLLGSMRSTAGVDHLATDTAASTEAGSSEEVNVQEPEYVFAHAGPRAWAEALAWVASFFISLYVLGLFVTAPVFAACYLWFAAKASWQVTVGYAAVTAIIFYGGFGWLLELPVPPGLF